MAIRTLAAACLILAACTFGPISPVPPDNPPTFPPSPGDIALCDLMPLSDVQAKSPFQTPLIKANVGVAGSCAYTSADESGDEVSIALRVQSLNSAKKAKASLDDSRQEAVDHGLPVSDVDGLGDAAFSSGVDEVSVRAVVGNRLVTATLQGEWPDTTDDAKVAAGTELVRTVISRLST